MNGKKLEELRIKNGFTRQELAELLDESASHVQSWEQGWYVNGPTASDIEDMAEAFKMSEDVLRKYIDHDEEDDYDPDEDDMSFGSYVARLSLNAAKVAIKESMKKES